MVAPLDGGFDLSRVAAAVKSLRAALRLSTVDDVMQRWSSSKPSRLSAGVATMPSVGRMYRHDQRKVAG